MCSSGNKRELTFGHVFASGWHSDACSGMAKFKTSHRRKTGCARVYPHCSVKLADGLRASNGMLSIWRTRDATARRRHPQRVSDSKKPGPLVRFELMCELTVARRTHTA